jgi:agmatinase
MKRHSKQYLDLPLEFSNIETSAVCILPVPYEGGITFGKGAAQGPEAIIDASFYLELYDEVLKAEPYRMGIATLKPVTSHKNPTSMQKAIYQNVISMVNSNKFIVGIGGDHSISPAFVKALKEKYIEVSVIILDAHSDLRESYEGSPLSHACAMARIREYTPDTLQIGIRSMSVEESKRIEKESLSVITMHEYRNTNIDLDELLNSLPDPVYLSIDVDVFDWSVIRSTGTPEPGGLMWDEAMILLEKIFMQKKIIGFDLVELAANPNDVNSPFAATKLIYKMLGFKLASEVKCGRIQYPNKPTGKIFDNYQ